MLGKHETQVLYSWPKLLSFYISGLATYPCTPNRDMVMVKGEKGFIIFLGICSGKMQNKHSSSAIQGYRYELQV
jgi:hypothetical protein